MNAAQSPGSQESYVLEAVIATAVSLLAFSAWLHTGYLAFENDPLYADVARTMVETGNWLDPSIHGVPFLDKPPLFFWLSAICVEILGDCTLAYRLPAAVAGAATVGLIFFMVRRAGGERTHATFAALALLACPLFFEFTRRAYMEAPVAFCVLAGIHFFHRALADETDGRAWLGAGLWTGLGFMLKSLVGLFGAVGFAVLLLVGRRWHLLRNRRLWRGVALGALVVLPWHLYALINQPEVFLDFTWKLHVEDQVFDAQPWSSGPALFYLEALCFETPWLGLLAVVAIVNCAIRRYRGEKLPDIEVLLFTCLVVMLVVFSLSATKKILYLIPLVPIVVTLAALQLKTVPLPRRWLLITCATTLFLGVRCLPLLDVDGVFLRGAEPYAWSAKTVVNAVPKQPFYVLNRSFTAAQFYGKRRAISVWTEERVVQKTRRIPYLRYGQNMEYEPEAGIRRRILEGPVALWFLAEGDAKRLHLTTPERVRYGAGGLFIIEGGVQKVVPDPKPASPGLRD